MDGGSHISLPVDINVIPIFIKAGTILPLGPKVQYSNEKPWDKLDIIIYPGADGSFTLYEDEFDNYNYEKGLYSTIDFKWNDKDRIFTIEDREGSYPGMLNSRKFNIKVIETPKKNGKTGYVQQRSIKYTGKQKNIQF